MCPTGLVRRPQAAPDYLAEQPVEVHAIGVLKRKDGPAGSKPLRG